VEAYGPVQATLDQIRSQHPTWTVQPSGSVGTDDGTGDAQRVSGVAANCTPEQAIAPYDGSRQLDRCQIFGSDNGWDITVVAVNTINPAAALSSDQRRQLEDGSLLTTSPELVRDGRARVALTSHGPDPIGPGSLVRTIEVPAVLVTVDQYRALAYSRNGYHAADGAIMTAVGAEQAGLPWTTYRWEIVDPAGPISQTAERTINGWAPTPMLVERGYQSSSLILVVLLGIAVALVLVGALTATALTQVEAAAEQATLTAVGATGGFRRWVAAAQATLIAGLGALLGAALGIVPGLGLAATLTTDWDPDGLDPVFVVPYAELAVVVLAVPVAAGVLAALMVRGGPGLRRRLT
jgi:putative ABC transport system permease protein